ncbi:cof-like hydrolase family protein [Lactobacillus selangorensis]|uniref:Cof-like hydrolase family protein n=1 Tax=Lactobacillus selangorensis TaxID=81857 RepID=A0A0R2FLN5_9LACO|nr:Cof-type HAD-IIB family hydrolase [Lactobacillus selangorensis]KRN29507.1 cof-like hydrolase family protein [Lactobacillus selangorensis]KRN33963.1 cof-like hydrolase family protein [Lactobacillus selangorensis]
MSKKLIAIDLDGTTLNGDSQITLKTQATLQAAQQAGNVVSIITGRSNRLSQNYYDQIGLKSPMVNFNGALAHIPRHQWDHEYQYTVPREVAIDLLQLKQKYAIQMIAVEGKQLLMADQLYKSEYSFFPTELAPEQRLTADSLTVDPTSITVFLERNDQKIVREQLQHDFPDVQVNVWGGEASVLEIVHKGIQKAKGVAYLADYFGFERKNIIAFGDEQNDREMLDYAGWGVAMQNARPEIQAAANDVTTYTNEQDGLADYLTNYLHLQK